MMIFKYPLFIFLFLYCTPTNEAETTLTLQHPYWKDSIKIQDNNRFCRTSLSNCGHIIQQTDSKITVKWDNYGIERFVKNKQDIYLFDEQSISEVIKGEYEKQDYTFEHPYIKQNIYNNNPLSAIIKFPTLNKALITIRIKGLNQLLTLFIRLKTSIQNMKYLY